MEVEDIKRRLVLDQPETGGAALADEPPVAHRWGGAASPRRLAGDAGGSGLRHPLFMEPGQGHHGLLLEKWKTDRALPK